MIDLFYVRVYLLVCRSGWFRLGVQEGCLGFYCCFTIAPGGDLCVVSLFTSKHSQNYDFGHRAEGVCVFI